MRDFGGDSSTSSIRVSAVGEDQYMDLVPNSI
jgi:hypothetical protein